MIAAKSRDERGAVAIMAVVLMGLLLITGALAADMGNAWARKRDMQTQADVAAISAANWGKDSDLWPADTSEKRAEITDEVARYILEDNNSAIGMSQTTTATVVAALTDGDASNGDIEFSGDGTEMRLVPPPATVQFGLATAFGYSSTDVTAAATVRLFSEVPNSDVVPLYIPNNCSFGAVEADTSGGPPPSSGPSDTGGFPVALAPESVNVGETVEVEITTAKSDLPNSGDVTVTFESATTQYQASVTPSTSGGTATLTIEIDSGNVTATDSTWTVTVTGKNGALSETKTLTVGAGTPEPPVTDPDEGCGGPDQGKFGQLNSPRKGYGLTARNTRLELNMREGLDHDLYPYLNAPSDSCETPGGQAAAQLDDDANRAGNNCIKGDQGNDGPAFADALLDGSGRLRASNGATKSGCGRSDDGAYNNDVLSCFLENGTTAAQIAQPSGVTQDMLDPSIVNSPRFVWIPVVYASDRALNDYQPILKFVPGLITSQTMTQSADEFDAANPGFHNGLECNGNSWPCNSLSRIRIFTFNPDALPDSAQSPIVGYDPDVGRETVRLVD
jgi:hypothetical protein